MDFTFHPFRQARPLILASSSPRRQSFLRELGLEFSVRTCDCEPVPCAGEEPEAYAQRAAICKAHAVRHELGDERKDNAVILSADTIVTFDGLILGKPESVEHAVEMLTRLAGRTHTVITACCLCSERPEESIVFADQTLVTFAPWPPAVLRAYAETGTCLDKAGSYGIQDGGSFLVERIEGSWTNVVGLPVPRVVALFLEWGVVL